MQTIDILLYFGFKQLYILAKGLKITHSNRKIDELRKEIVADWGKVISLKRLSEKLNELKREELKSLLKIPYSSRKKEKLIALLLKKIKRSLEEQNKPDEELENLPDVEKDEDGEDDEEIEEDEETEGYLQIKGDDLQEVSKFKGLIRSWGKEDKCSGDLCGNARYCDRIGLYTELDVEIKIVYELIIKRLLGIPGQLIQFNRHLKRRGHFVDIFLNFPSKGLIIECKAQKKI